MIKNFSIALLVGLGLGSFLDLAFSSPLLGVIFGTIAFAITYLLRIFYSCQE